MADNPITDDRLRELLDVADKAGATFDAGNDDLWDALEKWGSYEGVQDGASALRELLERRERLSLRVRNKRLAAVRADDLDALADECAGALAAHETPTGRRPATLHLIDEQAVVTMRRAANALRNTP